MFETQSVRDLVWALESPAMFVHRRAVSPHWGEAEVAKNPGLLARLDQPNSSLQKAVARRSTNRLGEYFEILLRTWIDEIPPARLLGSNVQIQGDAGTVGEFDLLFTRDGLTHHWELAVKFYLGFPGRSGPLWVGPDPSDVLHEKWKKMRRRQLRLSQHPASRRVLRRLGAHERVRAEAFVKGFLFDALNPRYVVGDHPHANPEVARGFWVHRGELASFRPVVPAETRWLRLGRLRWLSAVQPAETEQLTPLDDVVARFPDEPLLVAGVVPRDGGFREVSRGFVVPDGWPHVPRSPNGRR